MIIEISIISLVYFNCHRHKYFYWHYHHLRIFKHFKIPGVRRVDIKNSATFRPRLARIMMKKRARRNLYHHVLGD